MSEVLNEQADEVYSPEGASAYMGYCLGVQSLARKRLDGTGPKFIKFGSKVGYRRSSLDEFMAANECTKTRPRPAKAVAA